MNIFKRKHQQTPASESAKGHSQFDKRLDAVTLLEQVGLARLDKVSERMNMLFRQQAAPVVALLDQQKMNAMSDADRLKFLNAAAFLAMFDDQRLDQAILALGEFLNAQGELPAKATGEKRG